VVLLVLTAIGAIGVFLSVLVFVGDVSSKVGNEVGVLELTKDVGPFKPIDSSAYQVVKVPERWVSDAAIREGSDEQRQLSEMVTASELSKGSVLQTGMVVPQTGGQAGYREIAIVVDAETGVAGRVKPGDYVDIVATTGGDEQTRPCAKIVIMNALVLDVGVVTEAGGTGGDLTNRSGVPVTFSLTALESLVLAYWESFSTKLRLAPRAPGDESEIPEDKREFCAGDN
jgi:pilus assembly protein CpaB